MTVNGNAYDWESVEIRLPSGVAIGIEEISYSDERPLEEIYGKGGNPIYYGRKNYKASGSMTLYRDEFNRLVSSVGTSLYNADRFNIIVSYGNDDLPFVIDTLPEVKVTKIDTSTKQGDSNTSKIKIDFSILSPIKLNDVDQY